MYCSSCGTQLPEAAAFCPRCGAPAGVPGGGPQDEHRALDAPAITPLAAPAAAAPPSVITIAANAPYAGFWRRFVALFLDGLILTFITFPINLFMHIPMFGLMNADQIGFDEFVAMLTASLGAMMLGLLMAWLYYALLESSKLQGTLGKVALNIRVTDLGGRRISFARASGRFFGRVLSNLTLGIGYLIQVFTQRRQALHDLLAGTLVVRRSPDE